MELRAINFGFKGISEVVYVIRNCLGDDGFCGAGFFLKF